MTQEEPEEGACHFPGQNNPNQSPYRRGPDSSMATEEVCEPNTGSGVMVHSPLPEYDSGDEGDISTLLTDTHDMTDHDIPKVEKVDDQIRAEDTG